MNLLARLKAFTAQKWIASSMAYLSGGKDTKRPDFDYRSAVNAYRSWVYAAANLNAVAVASVPLRLYVRANGGGVKLWNTRRPSRRQKAYLLGGGAQRPSRYALRKAAEYGDDFEIVEDTHPILDLLTKVNPYWNGYDLTVLRILWTELTGNAYLHPVIDQQTGIPVELWPMMPQYVEIVPGQKGSANFIEGYRYGIKQEQQQIFAPDEVIHFKRPNPANLYYGIGKVEAAWGAVASNEAVHEMDYYFFANKARPDWLLTVKSDAAPEEIERLETQIDEKLRGKQRTGRFLTASADIDIKPLSFPPKDLAGREEIVEEIAAVFGVPVSMLKANDPNLASATTGFATWKETTILPMLRMDEETLNQTLLPLFGIEDDAFLAYDNPVMEDERFALESRRAAVAGGWRTANEARMEEGLEPIDDPMADRLLINGQPLGGPPPAALPGFGAASLDNPTESAGGIQSAALTFEPTPETKDALSDCVSEKIPKLIDEGYPQDQAVAIAYSMCSEGKSFEDAVASIERDEAIREKAISDIDTKPPQSVADNARRALEVRARKPESQRGMTAVGLARARDLQNRKPLSEDTIRRMLAYFERHESDKQGETWDDQGKGWQAWNGWGGDDGWAWARRKVEQFDREREKRVGKVEKSCGCGCRGDSIFAAQMESKDCGTGAGGFQQGNTCGEEEGSSDSPTVSRSEFAGDIDSYLDETTPSEVVKDFAGAIEKIEVDDISSDDVKASAVEAYQGDAYTLFTGTSDDVSITPQVERALSNFGYLSDAEIEARIDSGEDESDLQQEQDDSRENAIAMMRKSLETSVAASRLKCCVRLMRGLMLDDSEVDSIIKSGFVSHDGLNSWTTKSHIARRFSGSQPGSKHGDVRLVIEKPAVGYVNQNNSFEAEIIRPPSSMKVSKVVKTNTGTLIYVEEDDRL